LLLYSSYACWNAGDTPEKVIYHIARLWAKYQEKWVKKLLKSKIRSALNLGHNFCASICFWLGYQGIVGCLDSSQIFDISVVNWKLLISIAPQVRQPLPYWLLSFKSVGAKPNHQLPCYCVHLAHQRSPSLWALHCTKNW